MDINKVLANRLLMARKNVNMTQDSAAELMKMHRPSISEIEAGRRKVSADELSRFANIYKVSVNWLLGEFSDFYQCDCGNELFHIHSYYIQCGKCGREYMIPISIEAKSFNEDRINYKNSKV